MTGTPMLYTPDDRDMVFEATDFQSPLDGAPLPTVFATEHRLLLAYYIKLWQPEPPPNKRLSMPTLVDQSSLGTIAVVDFRRPAAFFSVPVSNETFDAHPFAFRGLTSSGVFRVEDSSWIRRLRAAQYCHGKSYAGAFSDLKHFIFVFHDSIFEVAANEIEVSTVEGSMGDAQDEMLQSIRERAL
jgi:hypothetical protein